MVGMKYALKGRMGYQCDSEWDGDTFTRDPASAWLYDTPVTGGRIAEQYECVKLRFWEESFPGHSTYIRSGFKKGKIRFRAICNRCGKATNAVASKESAEERARSFPDICTVTKHEVIKEQTNDRKE